MLRVPEDLATRFADTSVVSPDASVIRYRDIETVLTLPVLVTRPTFVLIQSGTKQLQRDETTTEARAGSILAMRSGTHVMSEFSGGPPDGYRSLVVSVSKAFLRRAVGESTASTPNRVAVSTPADHVRTLFEQLPDALDPTHSAAEREFKLRELIVGVTGDPKLRELVFSEVADWGSSIEDRITSVASRHHLEPVQVSELADLCAMSLSSFKRHFRAIYGQAPGRWLIEARLQHARSLVLHSDCSVQEICAACGYGDVSNFIRAFRSEFDTTPMEMRRATAP